MRRAYALIALFALSACESLTPGNKQAAIELPDRYSLVAPVSAPRSGDLNWWQNFNDSVLNTLVQHGLRENLSLATARARLQEADAELRRAGSFWTGSGRATAKRTSAGSETVSASAGAEIGLFGAGRRRVEAALERLRAAQASADDARRLLLSEVSIAYLDLRYFQQLLVNRRKDLASRRQTQNRIDKQMQAGAATRLDQLRARSLTEDTRIEIPTIEAQIIRQRNRLSTLLGVPVGGLNVDLNFAGRQPLPQQGFSLGVPADLLRARPDIRRAEQLYAAAVSDIAAARAARYPRLSLSGEIAAPLGGSATSTLGAGLILPVFNQPALEAGVDAAEARASQAYLAWRTAVLNAVEQVETAQAALQSAMRAQRAARRSVAVNSESLILSRQLLGSGGNATVLDVLDRERALSDARAASAQKTRDVAVNYVQLRVALGEGHAVSAATGADKPVE